MQSKDTGRHSDVTRSCVHVCIHLSLVSRLIRFSLAVIIVWDAVVPARKPESNPSIVASCAARSSERLCGEGFAILHAA